MPFTLRLFQDETCVMVTEVPAPLSMKLFSVQATVTWFPATPTDRISIDDINQELIPWHDLEEIAAWVRGDGSDAHAGVLADGILEGRRKPI